MSDEVVAPLLTVGLLCGLALFHPLLQLSASALSKQSSKDLPLSSEAERQTAASTYTTI